MLLRTVHLVLYQARPWPVPPGSAGRATVLHHPIALHVTYCTEEPWELGHIKSGLSDVVW